MTRSGRLQTAEKAGGLESVVRVLLRQRDAVVFNVFTELVLPASVEARLLYERMGFIPTNEMRYNGTFDEP